MPAKVVGKLFFVVLPLFSVDTLFLHSTTKMTNESFEKRLQLVLMYEDQIKSKLFIFFTKEVLSKRIFVNMKLM